ncbi:hypothetical protein HN51_060233 [Arachis hypogaea]|uniref:Uncharacterized protein n=1 Tax=Arachis hypogaea TaxID=3818 RepID=A0A444X8Z6_ARAHY|nr:hypothetical protein Ahy_B10g105842 isoform A [Arachis hypogaea]
MALFPLFPTSLSLHWPFKLIARRSLGELVSKLGECVLPLIIPMLSQGLSDPSSSRRQSVGLQAIDEIAPTLLHALEDDETSDTTLDVLK